MAKPKKCANSECENSFTPRYSTLEKYCSFGCVPKKQNKAPRKRINKVSVLRGREQRIYSKRRLIFLERPENAICFIPGCGRRATTIEHTRGRSGYADEYARQKGYTLLIDERYWKPCCLKHNLELENNPELSKANQLSKIHGGKKI